MTSDLAARAESWIAQKHEEWDALVDIALGLKSEHLSEAAKRLAKKAGVGPKTVLKKMEAIRFKSGQGWSVEYIKQAGQEETISSFVKIKTSRRTEPLVVFPHRLTPGVRDELQTLCYRLAKILALKSRRGNISYDDVFEFICADYATTTDAEILHRGGESTNHAQSQSNTSRAVDRDPARHTNGVLA